MNINLRIENAISKYVLTLKLSFSYGERPFCLIKGGQRNPMSFKERRTETETEDRGQRQRLRQRQRTENEFLV